MQMEEEGGHQKDSPILFRMDSLERISAAAADPDKNNTTTAVEGGDVEDDDFEFSFIQIPESGPPIAADDIFSNGMILPVYQLFSRDLLLGTDNDPLSSNFTVIQQKKKDEESKSSHVPLRRLFIEEEREQASFSLLSSSASSSSSSSSSSLDELDGIPPGTYCVWNPNQDRCKKSNSTGSTPSSLRWKLKDLVVGRSKSDGKEKFVFIPMIEKAAGIQEPIERKKEGNNNKKKNKDDASNKGGKLGMKKPIPREVDVVTARQRMTTTYRGQDVGKAAGRKSYLPYKRNLVGIFNVNGLTRIQDPF